MYFLMDQEKKINIFNWSVLEYFVIYDFHFQKGFFSGVSMWQLRE